LNDWPKETPIASHTPAPRADICTPIRTAKSPEPPLALSVPRSRFASQVGGGFLFWAAGASGNSTVPKKLNYLMSDFAFIGN
jgi:hypothetical protein